MNLGDAFNRRKKLGADLEQWINRLKNSGTDRCQYRTKSIEGSGGFVPEEGSQKQTDRHYTIEECTDRIEALVEEDQALAMQISLTNQVATSELEDLNGVTRTMSIPELLVLKNDIIPKLEQIARSKPVQANGVSVFETSDTSIKYRTVSEVSRMKETLTEKGHKVEDKIIEGYDVVEITDYGFGQRDVWNEVDRVQEFAQRVKQAISGANSTELVPLPKPQ